MTVCDISVVGVVAVAVPASFCVTTTEGWFTLVLVACQYISFFVCLFISDFLLTCCGGCAHVRAEMLLSSATMAMDCLVLQGELTQGNQFCKGIFFWGGIAEWPKLCVVLTIDLVCACVCV